MSNLKDLKELMIKAKSEYKNSKEKNEKHYAFYTVMSIYAIASLSVFIMPKDILERHEILLKFTEFMAGYFPNISVFNEASSLPQVVAFYTAIMWVAGLMLGFYIIISLICVFYQDIKYNKVNNNEFLSSLLLFSISVFAIYVHFTGYIATDGISFLAKSFIVDMSSRLEIFLFVAFFQTAFSLLPPIGLYAIASWIYEIIYKMKNKRS